MYLSSKPPTWLFAFRFASQAVFLCCLVDRVKHEWDRLIRVNPVLAESIGLSGRQNG